MRACTCVHQIYHAADPAGLANEAHLLLLSSCPGRGQHAIVVVNSLNQPSAIARGPAVVFGRMLADGRV
jgi:hypothetical protein